MRGHYDTMFAPFDKVRARGKQRQSAAVDVVWGVFVDVWKVQVCCHGWHHAQLPTRRAEPCHTMLCRAVLCRAVPCRVH